jgi:short-subunit dehydrogenase
MANFVERYGRWAVVTGGSYGTGASFARQIAEQGCDLVLVARDGERLNAYAQDLRGDFPARDIVTVAADLSDPAALDRIVAAADRREVGLLVCNAGTGGKLRDFVDGDIAYDLTLVDINIVAKMKLVHHFGRAMARRGRGGIILCESTAGLAGNPGLASYSAAKSFGRVFAEALWHEMREHGVDVLALVLGMTQTPSNAANFPMLAGLGMTAADAVCEGLDRICDGPVHVSTPSAGRAEEVRRLTYREAVESAYAGTAALRGCPPGE